MSIAIKVPVLPYAATEARVGHWYKAVGEVVARNEILVELLVRDEIIPILAPQAGIVEKIFFNQNQVVGIGVVIARLKTGLPNLVWDSDQEALILDTYRADATTNMEYDLRQLLRVGEGKYGNGFGSGLALPQSQERQQSHGFGEEANAQPVNYFKANPLLANSAQFAGDPKDTHVNSVPANREAQLEPKNAPSFGSAPRPGGTTPTLKPTR